MIFVRYCCETKQNFNMPLVATGSRHEVMKNI